MNQSYLAQGETNLMQGGGNPNLSTSSIEPGRGMMTTGTGVGTNQMEEVEVFIEKVFFSGMFPVGLASAPKYLRTSLSVGVLPGGSGYGSGMGGGFGNATAGNYNQPIGGYGSAMGSTAGIQAPYGATSGGYGGSHFGNLFGTEHRTKQIGSVISGWNQTGINLRGVHRVPVDFGRQDGLILQLHKRQALRPNTVIAAGYVSLNELRNVTSFDNAVAIDRLVPLISNHSVFSTQGPRLIGTPLAFIHCIVRRVLPLPDFGLYTPLQQLESQVIPPGKPFVASSGSTPGSFGPSSANTMTGSTSGGYGSEPGMPGYHTGQGTAQYSTQQLPQSYMGGGYTGGIPSKEAQWLKSTGGMNYPGSGFGSSSGPFTGDGGTIAPVRAM